MKFLEPFGAAMVILQESIKLLPKNKKLGLTILPTLLLCSLFFLNFNFSIKSLPEQDYGLMLIVDMITFILVYSIITLFSTIAIISLAAISRADQWTLGNLDFDLLVLGSWKRPLRTAFFIVSLIDNCFIVWPTASPLNMLSGIATADALSILILAIVISVIEENCYGIEALRRAGKLIQGKRIQLCVLNIIFVLLPMVLTQGFRIIRGREWSIDDTIFGLFVANITCLIRLLHFVALTVFYFQCNSNQTEEIEHLGGAEDTKIITIQLLDDSHK